MASNRGYDVVRKKGGVYRKVSIIKYNSDIWKLIKLLKPSGYLSFLFYIHDEQGYTKTKERDFSISKYIEKLIEEKIKNENIKLKDLIKSKSLEIKTNQENKKKGKVSSITIYNQGLWLAFRLYCLKEKKEVSKYLESLIIEDLKKGGKIKKEKLKAIINKYSGKAFKNKKQLKKILLNN